MEKLGFNLGCNHKEARDPKVFSKWDRGRLSSQRTGHRTGGREIGPCVVRPSRFGGGFFDMEQTYDKYSGYWLTVMGKIF